MGSDCQICSQPLAGASSVVYKDDQLIHAGCWSEGPKKAPQPKATAAPDKKPPGRSAA